MLTCHDIAKYFLSLSSDDAGDLISNLKLQKLAYYAQGFSLALNNIAIFPENIEAWTHGPVIPPLYHSYKEYNSSAIPSPTNMDFDIYSKETQDFLDEIYSVFGQFSAWKLRNMTHEEPPWRDAAEYSGVISHDSMREYFLTQISNDV